jgi:hypothetical protein
MQQAVSLAAWICEPHENVAEVLHSSTTAATTSSSVETPSPHDVVVTPAHGAHGVTESTESE